MELIQRANRPYVNDSGCLSLGGEDGLSPDLACHDESPYLPLVMACQRGTITVPVGNTYMIDLDYEHRWDYFESMRTNWAHTYAEHK